MHVVNIGAGHGTRVLAEAMSSMHQEWMGARGLGFFNIHQKAIFLCKATIAIRSAVETSVLVKRMWKMYAHFVQVQER